MLSVRFSEDIILSIFAYRKNSPKLKIKQMDFREITGIFKHENQFFLSFILSIENLRNIGITINSLEIPNPNIDNAKCYVIPLNHVVKPYSVTELYNSSISFKSYINEKTKKIKNENKIKAILEKETNSVIDKNISLYDNEIVIHQNSYINKNKMENLIKKSNDSLIFPVYINSHGKKYSIDLKFKNFINEI